MKSGFSCERNERLTLNAVWMFGPNWPHNGEIDIIEGVNQNEANLMSLHTSVSLLVSFD